MLSYFSNSKSPLYSFLFTLPLFIVYEIGIFISSIDQTMVIRNGADVLLRQLFSYLGLNGFKWLGIIFLISYLITFLIHKRKLQNTKLNLIYLPFMIFESIIWSMLIYLFMTNIHLLLMQPTGNMIIQRVTLAIGAGIYEEFLFRSVLILTFTKLLIFIFRVEYNYSRIIAMFISAGIFSGFHFIGDFGDLFSFNTFMIRFFAGILLGVIYFSRGFGITAWAHSIYDLIILTKITVD